MIGSAHEPRQDGRERRALCGQKSWEEQKSVLFPRFPSEVEVWVEQRRYCFDNTLSSVPCTYVVEGGRGSAAASEASIILLSFSHHDQAEFPPRQLEGGGKRDPTHRRPEEKGIIALSDGGGGVFP